MAPVTRGAKRKQTTTDEEAAAAAAATTSKTRTQGVAAKGKGKAKKRKTAAKRKGKKTTKEEIKPWELRFNPACYGEIALKKVEKSCREIKRRGNIKGRPAYEALITKLKRLEEFKDIPQDETYLAAIDLLFTNKKGVKINIGTKDRVSKLTCRYLSLRLDELAAMCVEFWRIDQWNHAVACFVKEMVGYYREVIQVRVPELEKLHAVVEAVVNLGSGSVLETKACEELTRTLVNWKLIRYKETDLEPFE